MLVMSRFAYLLWLMALFWWRLCWAVPVQVGLFAVVDSFWADSAWFVGGFLWGLASSWDCYLCLLDRSGHGQCFWV